MAFSLLRACTPALKSLVIALGLAGAVAAPVGAQQLTAQRGQALSVNPMTAAGKVSMRDMYARGLFLYIRSNPAVLDNQEFYVNFLIYLMTTTPGFDCSAAFADEFERRDYFTQSFSIKPQLQQVVNSVSIPERFDIAYSIDTGRYDFTTGNLPFSRVTSIGLREERTSQISAGRNARGCATSILRGTSVGTDQFPWTFSVVDEAAQTASPGFPFGGSMTLSDADARVLFQQFGRQLYSVVSYRFQAANNGDRKVQIVPTDGQLFGLSSDAVVRVKSYAHPTLSQASYLDMSHPLTVTVPDLGVTMGVTFQQQGFRAVGTGTRKDGGTSITTGGTYPVSGSAAVGNSVFIMRLATPQLNADVRDLGLSQTQGTERYLTLFGSVMGERVTENSAPVSGRAVVLQLDPATGELEASQGIAFSGAFTPASATPAAPAPAPQSELDQSPVAPAPAPGTRAEN